MERGEEMSLSLFKGTFRNVMPNRSNRLQEGLTGGFLAALGSSLLAVAGSILYIPASAINALLYWMYSDPVWHFALVETGMAAALGTLLLGSGALKKRGGGS